MDNSFLHRKKLLLVDDELDLLKMLSDILKDAGFQKILMADTGKEAVAEAKKGKPDLIILDVMLPDKDGFSLMEQLRSFTDVPIIFLTAKDEAADKLAGLGLGADDYIVKPFLPQELILRIYAVLRRSYKEDNPLVVLDGCTVDFDRAEVYKGNEIFFLTAKEHMLLKTVVLYPVVVKSHGAKKEQVVLAKVQSVHHSGLAVEQFLAQRLVHIATKFQEKFVD